MPRAYYVTYCKPDENEPVVERAIVVDVHPLTWAALASEYQAFRHEVISWNEIDSKEIDAVLKSTSEAENVSILSIKKMIEDAEILKHNFYQTQNAHMETEMINYISMLNQYK